MADSDTKPEVTWKHALTIWWALFWRTSIVGGVLIAIFEIIKQTWVPAASSPPVALMIDLLVLLLSMIVTITLLKQVLQIRYGSFSIRIVAHNSG